MNLAGVQGARAGEHSFAVLLRELLTGKAAADVVALHMMEPDLFKDMQITEKVLRKTDEESPMLDPKIEIKKMLTTKRLKSSSGSEQSLVPSSSYKTSNNKRKK